MLSGKGCAAQTFPEREARPAPLGAGDGLWAVATGKDHAGEGSALPCRFRLFSPPLD